LYGDPANPRYTSLFWVLTSLLDYRVANLDLSFATLPE
jgi:hypothetical protein